MRRPPTRRRTPIKRRTSLKRSGRIKPKWPRRSLGEVVGLIAHFGLHPKCVCCGRPATELHHILPKGRGGGDEFKNLAPVCRHPCHHWIHNNPEAANAAGLLKHSWDA